MSPLCIQKIKCSSNFLFILYEPLVGAQTPDPAPTLFVTVPALACALPEQGDCHQEPHGDDSSSLGRQEACVVILVSITQPPHRLAILVSITQTPHRLAILVSITQPPLFTRFQTQFKRDMGLTYLAIPDQTWCPSGMSALYLALHLCFMKG